MGTIAGNVARRQVADIESRLRVAEGNEGACWRNIERHMAVCGVCRSSYDAGDGAGVACDDGRLARTEWALAVARIAELRRHLRRATALLPAETKEEIP